MPAKKIPIYLVSILLFMVLLPLLCVAIQWKQQDTTTAWPLIGKWFVFWPLGVRLFIAGLRQATKPAFTAREIFHLKSDDCFPIIKELGFANISMGGIAILSLFFPSWRIPAAAAGGLYFGLAGLLHLFKKRDSTNETIAMISDFYIFLLMALYLAAVL